MDTKPLSDRAPAIVAAIVRGMPLRTVLEIYRIDMLTVERFVEAAGRTMPVDQIRAHVYIADREAQMLRRALDGEGFTAIATSLDCSREWVRQIVRKHTGLSAKDLKDVRDAARQQVLDQRLADMVEANPDMTLDELASQAGMLVTEVAQALGPAEAARRRRNRSVTTATSHEQVLDDMRRVAALPGGQPLSGPFYDEHRGEGVTSTRIIQVFGTWGEAGRLAGVSTPEPIRGTYTQRWDREDCLRSVRAYLDSADNPSFARFDAWSRDVDGAPSSGTVRLRCGKWIETVAATYALDVEPDGAPAQATAH